MSDPKAEDRGETLMVGTTPVQAFTSTVRRPTAEEIASRRGRPARPAVAADEHTPPADTTGPSAQG